MVGRVPLQAVTAQGANKRVYYHLYAAQALALVSTGIATVALALLAYQLAGGDAGAVLGTALAIKMATYVVITPVAAAFVERLPRRTLMVCLDLARAAVVLTLPFVTRIWEIYVLIFAFQAASAPFTPTYQATVPDLLPDEEE
jgi:MFS family permease